MTRRNYGLIFKICGAFAVCVFLISLYMLVITIFCYIETDKCPNTPPDGMSYENY